MCERERGQHALDGEVDNGWVLLDKEVVLGKALEVQHEVLWQLEQLKLADEDVFVCLELVLAHAVKLVEQLKQRHLGGMQSQYGA